MRQRTQVGFVLAAFLMLVILPCWAESPEPEKAGELEKTSITLHFQPNAHFAPHSVAIKKGWLEEAGFTKIDRKTFASGAQAGEAFLADQLDFWDPGNMPVISQRHQGIPVVVVGALNAAPAEWLMVRNDAGVDRPEDLYKIKIGLLVGSTATGVLENMADHYGLDINRIQVVSLPPPEQLTALQNNEIQAMIVWPPFVVRAKDVATYRFDSLKFSHTFMPHCYKEDYIRKYPNTAKKIFEIILRGVEFCADPANKNEAIKIHAEIAEQPENVVGEAWDEIWGSQFPHGIVDQEFVRHFEGYTDFQVKTGRIKGERIHILDYLYTDMLKEIKPEWLNGVEGRWKP